MKRILGVLSLGLCAMAASAMVKISGMDYVTITNAVAHASSGDTILISTGVYAEVVRIGSKNLVLDGGYNYDCSAKVLGEQTVIDVSSFFGPGSVMTISNSFVSLYNLDLRGGHGAVLTATYLGGGLKLIASSVVTASNCRVYSNSMRGKGGGIFVTNSSLYLVNTSVYSNEARLTAGIATPPNDFGWGGGICVEDGRLDLSGESVVSNNWAHNEGGGIFSRGSVTYIHHTDADILWNSASNGAGVAVQGGSFTVNSGADIANNTAESWGGGILLRNGATGLVSGSQTSIGLNSSSLGPNQATNGNGGGICVLDSVLVVSNSARVAHNRAASSGGGIYVSNGVCRLYRAYIGFDGHTNYATAGGGVAAQQSTVLVASASQVLSSRALSGGGLALDGCDVVIERDAIVGDEDPVVANMAWVGGGVYAGNSRINLQGKIWNNAAVVIGGGGLALEACHLIASNAQIIGNTAAATGGGVDWYSGSGTFYNVSMVSNSAVQGGGVNLRGHVRLECLPTNTISYNFASGHGGGFYCGSTGLVMLQEATIYSNSAGLHGGGAGVVSGEVQFTDCQVSHNVAGRHGGALYASNGMVIVFASTINSFYNSNCASNGGCLAAERNGLFFLMGQSNLFITFNTATNDGGGVWLNNAFLFGRGHIQVGGNTAGDNGGGLYAENSGVLQLLPQSDSLPTIYNNLAQRCGGGLCATGAGTSVKLVGVRVGMDFAGLPGGNVANGAIGDDGGGGLSLLARSTCYLTNIWVGYNESARYGGGINLDGARLIMGGDYSTLAPGDFQPPNNILHNQAANEGGGLAVIRGILEASDVLIHSNTARLGGGLLLDQPSTGRLVNAVITHNSASVTGGAVRIEPESLGDFLHCTVAGNLRGGVSVHSTAFFSLTNGIVGLNNPEEITAGQSVSYSDVAGGYPGAGNIMVNPLFIASTWYDTRLSYGSLCIDAGTALAAVQTDVIGEPRPFGANHDMGAYEYNMTTYDTDGDRITDGWEFDHGLNPTNPADAAMNFDPDPYLNIEEYVSDTDPYDGTDHLQIVSITTNGATRDVSFLSSTARVYALYATPRMTNDATWVVVGTNFGLRGNGATYTTIDTNAPSGQGFYRVDVQVP